MLPILAQAKLFYEPRKTDPALASTYKYFLDHPVAPLNQKRLQLILDSIAILKKKSILDLACGGGLITSAIAGLGVNAIGLDIDEREIQTARQFASTISGNAKFESCDFINGDKGKELTEQLLQKKPDLVVLGYALHHFKNPELVLEKLSAWLEPGSVLLVNEENPCSPLFRLKHFIRGVIQKDTDIEFHRSFNEWVTLCARYGFELLPLFGRQLRSADMFTFIARLTPSLSWSIVFALEKK